MMRAQGLTPFLRSETFAFSPTKEGRLTDASVLGFKTTLRLPSAQSHLDLEPRRHFSNVMRGCEKRHSARLFLLALGQYASNTPNDSGMLQYGQSKVVVL